MVLIFILFCLHAYCSRSLPVSHYALSLLPCSLGPDNSIEHVSKFQDHQNDNTTCCKLTSQAASSCIKAITNIIISFILQYHSCQVDDRFINSVALMVVPVLLEQMYWQQDEIVGRVKSGWDAILACNPCYWMQLILDGMLSQHVIHCIRAGRINQQIQVFRSSIVEQLIKEQQQVEHPIN